MPAPNPLTRDGTCGWVIHHRGYIMIQFDRDRLLTEILKRGYQPNWNRSIGCWVLPEILCREVVKLLSSQLDNLIHATTEGVHPADGSARVSVDDWNTLQVLPGAPKVVVDAAYRALATIYHPDRSGSSDQMARINGAYERLKKILV